MQSRPTGVPPPKTPKIDPPLQLDSQISLWQQLDLRQNFARRTKNRQCNCTAALKKLSTTLRGRLRAATLVTALHSFKTEPFS